MTIRRTFAALALALLAAVLVAPAASAHVTIPDPGVQGGFSIVTFSVPNERDDAGTVTLEVQLPQDNPLGFVSVQPKPGWTVSTTTRTLDEPIDLFGEEVSEVTDTVTWTGGEIAPGEFDTFSISVGPLPEDVDELMFPAIQTYSSGEEVAWIEEHVEGEEEPEHPAPVLTLLAPEDVPGAHVEGGETDDMTDTTDETEVTVDAEEAADSEDEESDGLAIAALVLAGIGTAIAIVALLATRRRTT
jgi:uncharacterized protein YcnI